VSLTERISYRLSDDPRFGEVGTPRTVTDERYILEIAAEEEHITVVHSSNRGRHWGREHARRLLAQGSLETSSVDQHPRFPVRGIIEGFYGEPWSHEQRLDMIRFLGSHRMNTFAYAPKDDPYCRRKWMELYPTPLLNSLEDLVHEADACGVAIAYGLSPGLSIRYSDRADVVRLVAKYRQVASLGVRQFHLLLDDIPETLQHPSDRAMFPDLANAHVELISQVRRALDEEDPGVHLAVCPTVYHGKGDEPYVAALGANTDPRVDLMWTGRAICSPELDLADAALFARTTSRPVLYWDNYPVNDVAMTAELHLGAYRGRDPHLFRFSRGVIANPMDRPESSKIALATIADYLWDPESYDPDRSWDNAIEEVAGARDARALRLFADNVRTSCLEEADSLLLTEALQQLEFEEELGDPKVGRLALAELADQFIDAATSLLSPNVENSVLAAEIRPWVKVFATGAQQLRDMLDGKPSVADAHGASASPAVFGDVLDMFVRSGPTPIDRSVDET